MVPIGEMTTWQKSFLGERTEDESLITYPYKVHSRLKLNYEQFKLPHAYIWNEVNVVFLFDNIIELEDTYGKSK